MIFEKLSANLNLLMAGARLNSNELARRTGIPASSIKKIRNNNNPNPTLSTLAPLANYFSMTVSQLIGDTALSVNQTPLISTEAPKKAPIITWQESTQWPQINTQRYPTISIDQPYDDTYCLPIKDEIGAIFSRGSLVVVAPNTTPQQHDYVIFLKGNQNVPTLKQILIEDDEIFLQSLSIGSHVIKKLSEDKILGVVMECRKYLR